MSLSELVVPVLLCFTACYALGKRVDVYTALTRGAEEGLNVLVHILPSLIALLTAVYMFRASGAMEYLGALLAPALERVGIPPEVAPLLFIRPISGSGALAVGSEHRMPLRACLERRGRAVSDSYLRNYLRLALSAIASAASR